MVMMEDHTAAPCATSTQTLSSTAVTKMGERKCEWPKSHSARALNREPGGRRQVKSLMAHGPQRFIRASSVKITVRSTGAKKPVSEAPRKSRQVKSKSQFIFHIESYQLISIHIILC